MRRILAGAILTVAVLAGPKAGAQAPAAPDPMAAKCQGLLTADFARIPDAPTRITGAIMTAATESLPAYCRVEGTVNTTVGIEMKLPVNWNGKFAHVGSQYAHVGCTGTQCGPAFTSDECDGPLIKGYACIVDDLGHRTIATDASWAYQNPTAQMDFAFRAGHLSTVAGKAITQQLYGAKPKRSYFFGCSAAGREAMVEAQLFPEEYDGIVAGSVPLHYATNAMRLYWNALALLGPDGKTLFPAEAGKRFAQHDFEFVYQWLNSKCDNMDGVVDRAIPDPRKCTYDFAELQCKGPKTDSCISAEQVAAMKKVFDGPRDSKGRPLTLLHPYYGSEHNWAYSYMAEGGGPETMLKLRDNALTYLNVSADLSAPQTAMDWEANFKKAALQDALYGATNPDLRAFKANGGKLIAYQGWSDHEVLPDNMHEYYNTVTKLMGGAPQTMDFFRLFMIPGMDNCGNGASSDKTEWMKALEEWVEQGKAPEVMIAYQRSRASPKYTIWPGQSGYWLTKPWDKSWSMDSKPIYPYPTVAKYKGKGDPKDYANWGPTKP